jgi:hypothetical protein
MKIPDAGFVMLAVSPINVKVTTAPEALLNEIPFRVPVPVTVSVYVIGKAEAAVDPDMAPTTTLRASAGKNAVGSPIDARSLVRVFD